MTTRTKEQAVLIGRSRSLMGIFARPGDAGVSVKPAVIILNTGIVHRVGHHRMYVTMARELAEAGHAVLRFDFSGIGDSPSRADGLALLPACLSEIREAIDWLTDAAGVQEVIVLGLCSGADLALRYGCTDPRVVGLVLLDPSIPPTARYYFHYIAERMTRLSSWLSFGLGRGRIWNDLLALAGFALGYPGAPRSPSIIDPRTREDLEQLYQASVDNGIHLLAVLTGGRLAARQTYREQLLDALPNVSFNGRLQLEHFADCDHTFGSIRYRQLLGTIIKRWAGETPFRRQRLPARHPIEISTHAKQLI